MKPKNLAAVSLMPCVDQVAVGELRSKIFAVKAQKKIPSEGAVAMTEI